MSPASESRIRASVLLIAAAVLSVSCKPPQKMAHGDDEAGVEANLAAAIDSEWALPPGEFSETTAPGGVPIGQQSPPPPPPPPPPAPPRSDADLLLRFGGAKMADILAALGKSAVPKGEAKGDLKPDARSQRSTGVDAMPATSVVPGETGLSIQRDTGLPVELAALPRALADFDNDGFADLIVVSPQAVRLFRGDAETSRFTEYVDDGLEGINGGRSCQAADFDGDGQVDLLVLRGEGLPSSLLRNLGDGHFADVTVDSSLLDFRDTVAAACADFDADGVLDLLLANGGDDQRCGLYIGDGDGGFDERSHEWLLRERHPGLRDVALIDFDADGWLDLVFVSDDSVGLYRNVDGEKFAERRSVDGAQGRAVRVTDLDEDGLEDLLLGGAEGWGWWRNVGDGGFDDVSNFAGLDELKLARPDAQAIPVLVVADLDGDGDQDLCGGNPVRLALNRRGDRFVELDGAVLKGESSATLAAADVDGDGDVDVLLGERLLISSAAVSAAWTRVRLTPDLAGAALTITVRDKGWIQRDLHRRIGPGDRAFLSLALGEAEVITAVRLRRSGEAAPREIVVREDGVRGEIALKPEKTGAVSPGNRR